MNDIVTLTLNAALDVNTSVAHVLPERKLKCAEPIEKPGGGGINVARAIKKLGGDAQAVYLAGGDTGKEIARLLKAESVISEMIQGHGTTRQNLIVADRSSGEQYLFAMPGPAVSEQECCACLDAIEQHPNIAYLVVSGSMPTGTPDNFFDELKRVAQRKKARLIIDTSGPALQQTVDAGAYLVKPNLKELGLLVENENLTEEYAAEAAQQVLRHSCCEVIVVSMASKGVLVVTKDFCRKIPAPSVTPLGTVGAGDSLLGGMVLYLTQGKSLIDAVRYGVACGTAATLSPGTDLCDKATAVRLFSEMST